MNFSKNEVGETPLHKASENGQTETVKELLDNGARIDLHVGSNPEGCNGSNCERYCYPEGNALHLAIKSGNVETVQLLLNCGATLNNKCDAIMGHNFTNNIAINGMLKITRFIRR